MKAVQHYTNVSVCGLILSFTIMKLYGFMGSKQIYLTDLLSLLENEKIRLDRSF